MTTIGGAVNNALSLGKRVRTTPKLARSVAMLGTGRSATDVLTIGWVAGLESDSVLRLSSAGCAWLRSSVSGVVDELDLDRTYRFQHDLNASRCLERQHASERDFLWRLLFFDGHGSGILNEPVARKLCAALPYWGRRGVGPVAFNARFSLKECYWGQQFATAVYASERDLLLRWGIKEIQMVATDNGPAVWTRRRFGFRPKDSGALAEKYVSWANRQRGDVQLEPPTDPAEYPLDFLRTVSELFLYRTLP